MNRNGSQEKVEGRYCVVIAAYNAAATIGSLVRWTKQQGFTVLVVDDGSSDKTASIASQEGALVLSHLKNRGKGSALRTAFQYALRSNFDGVVTLDSDVQHDPADIVRLIQAGEHQHAAIVVGNRMEQDKEMPRLRYWTNVVMSRVIGLLTHQSVPDSQCGLRMIRKQVLESIEFQSERFEIESEMILAASRQKWKVIFVPMKALYPEGLQSHIQTFPDALRFIWLIVRYLGGTVGKRKPS